jgi:hypothetical protein
MSDQPSTNEPRVGDIVVYVGWTAPTLSPTVWDRRRERETEYLVVRTHPVEGVQVIEIRDADNEDWSELDWFVCGQEPVRVVRRASYTEVVS